MITTATPGASASPLSPDALRKAAIFVTGSKGGPGKSTTSNLLVDYYRSRGIATAAYDGDHNNQSLIQHYGMRDASGVLLEEQDPIRGVEVINIRKPEERDLLINVVEREATRVIIDLPGGGGEDVADVLTDTQLFFQTFRDAGITPVVMIVISTVKAAAFSVPATINLFGEVPQYIVVKNAHFGDDFAFFDGEKQADGTHMYGGPKRAIERVGGAVMRLPALQRETYEAWDKASTSVQAGETDKRFMQLADRLRIKAWRAEFAAAIAGTELAV